MININRMALTEGERHNNHDLKMGFIKFWIRNCLETV